MNTRPAMADETDLMRAQAYMLVATLLAAPPSEDLLQRLASLTGDDSDWGRALRDLSDSARATTAAEAEKEYNRLFIGLQMGELVPYASYYITGFLHDRPLVSLRTDMARFGIARSAGVAEPEDHIAGIMEIMAGLIEGRFGAAASRHDQHEFYHKYLDTWAPRFFDDLERAESARFYKSVGTCGRVLLEIENSAAALA